MPFHIRLSFWFIFFFFLAFTLSSLLLTSYFYLSFNTDLPIYSHALQHIRWNDLNPFNYVRQVKIFNDHFDVVVIPIALALGKIIPPSVIIHILEPALFAFSAFLVYLYAQRNPKEITPSMALFVAAYLLLNRGTFMGVFFSGHPTIWSVLPITLVALSFLQKSFGGVLFSLLLLFACKEEFPYVGVMASFVYFLRREPKKALIVLAVSLLWISIIFSRKWFLGGYVVPYSNVIKNIAHPWTVLSNLYHTFFVQWNGKTAFEYFYILSPAFLVIIYALIKERKNVAFDSSMLFLLIPPLLIRILASFNAFVVQYAAPLTSFFAMFILMSFRKVKINGFVLFFSIFLLFLFDLEDIARSIGIRTKPIDVQKEGGYAKLYERRENIQKWMNFLNEKGDSINIISNYPILSDLKGKYRISTGWTVVAGWGSDLNAKLPKQETYFFFPNVNLGQGKYYALLGPDEQKSVQKLFELFRSKGEVLEDGPYIFLAKIPHPPSFPSLEYHP